MNKTAFALGLAFLPILFAVLPAAYAHSEIQQGDVTIAAGWSIEPPLQGQANGIEIKVTQGNDPVTNAFENAQVTIRKGGITKVLDLKPGEEAGAYTADIIPTQLGKYSVEIKGSVAGQDFSEDVELEDVGDTRSINFPEAGGGSQGVPDDFVQQMRGVITDLTAQVEGAKGSSQDARAAAQSAAESAAEVRASADRAYLVGMVGIGTGVAGIAIAAVALRRA